MSDRLKSGRSAVRSRPWPQERIRAACVPFDKAATAAAPSSTGIRLLADIRDVWPFDAANSFIETARLLERLVDLPDGPWGADEQTGVPELTGRRLAVLLKPYGITPGKNDERTLRGYHRYQFDSAWRRYLASKREAKPDDEQ